MPTTAQPIDFEGIPTDTDMEATLLPEPDEMFAFRNVFQVDNQAPNRDGDSVTYPSLDDDFEGDLVKIAKDEPHPEAKLSYEGLSAAWTEYGFKFRIRDKDVRDSKVNLVIINQQEMAREEMRRLDALAGLVLENNRNSVEIGSASDLLNYEAVLEMETELVDAGYNPNRFAYVVSPRGWSGLARSDEFVTETERFAEELRNTGVRHGEILGHPVIRTNTGFMDDNDAYLVDTGIYGWESPRNPFDVTTWRDEDQRCQFYAMNGEIDWVPTEPEAAIKAVGGVSEE